MKNAILLLCGFSLMSSITAQTSIDPKDIRQNSTARMVTDDQIAAWNRIPAMLNSIPAGSILNDATHRWVTDAQIVKWSSAPAANSIPSAAIQQDDAHRFVTAQQVDAWNRTMNMNTDAVKPEVTSFLEDQLHRYITDAERLKWNKPTKIEKGYNVDFIQVNDSTIRPILTIPVANSYDRDRIPAPAAGSFILMFNSDDKQLYFRTSSTNWRKIWSDN